MEEKVDSAWHKMQGYSGVCVKNHENWSRRYICFEAWEYTIVVFPCDCGAFLYSFEKNIFESTTLANLRGLSQLEK